jgi:predicted nuclease of predicted toxin-antitoxin system
VTVALYMDVHVPLAITKGLRQRGIDILRSQEDGTTTLADPDLLDRATVLNRVLVTQDRGFLTEAARRQQGGISFAGVIYAAQATVTIGQCVQDLEIIGKCCNPADLANQVTRLPLS